MPKIVNQELEKLINFLEKYVKIMEDEVNKSEKSGEKQKLETKIEKAQLYLDKVKIPQNRNFIELDQPKKYWGSTEDWKEPVCERYSFKHENRPITLDVIQELNKKLELTPEDNFYVAEEVLARKDEEGVITIENESEIFLQRHLIKTESNTGKIAGTASGAGIGAAGGAAAGAGLMVALAPYTFGLSLSLVPTAAITGAVVGSLSGGATGLVSGVVADKILNSETVKIKSEVKGCLEDYKIIMEEKSCSCQAIIDNEASTSGEKEKSQAQKESYDNEVREIEAYIENNLK